jgi:hypothetical protein
MLLRKQYAQPASVFPIALLIILASTLAQGNAAIYIATNLTGPWRYVGNLANQMTFEPEARSTCMPLA